MTLTTPSEYLRALARYGREADVTLLGRLGPACALYVDSQPHRRRDGRARIAEPFDLTEPELFAFCCDHIEETDKVFAISNVAGPYVQHLRSAVPSATGISNLLYLFMVAIETTVPGIAEDALYTWTTTKEHVADIEAIAKSSFYSSALAPVYNIKPPAGDEAKREDSTVAEFLYGRSAHNGRVCNAILAQPSFQRFISVYALNQTMRSISDQSKRRAMDASYLPVKVKRCVLDPSVADETLVDVQISDGARALIEVVANREPVQVVDWFAKLAEEQQTVVDIVAATHGDIVMGVSESRVNYISQCAPPAPPAQIEAVPSQELVMPPPFVQTAAIEINA